MEEILINLDWLAIVVGTVVAYGFGSLWYSPKMFGAKWMQGVGLTKENKTNASKAMVVQLVGTFLLAWVVGVAMVSEAIVFSVLVALAVATLIKANGLWAGKSKYAIVTESGYILVMVAIIILTHVVI